MTLTKIMVLVAHEGEINPDQLCRVIETAVGSECSNTIFEVRDWGTDEVTLASIVGALNDGYPLQRAKEPDEVPGVTA